MTTWKDDRKKAAAVQKRPVPKMPEGYYSGDKPNPNLRAFVEAHMRERPCDPGSNCYNVSAFNEPIKTSKVTAIYNMHRYDSKKPHDAIRQYIIHYTQRGDLVLDPFCGSGGTALAALIEDRKAIAIDRSPAATFITRNYCIATDINSLGKEFEELKSKVKPEIDWLYETRCDRCGGRATTAYTVYSQIFRCPRCMEKVALFDCLETKGWTKAGKVKKIRVCPHCHKRGIAEEISTSGVKFGAKPVLVSYICENGCKPSRNERRHDDPDPKKREYFDRYDLFKIREIEDVERKIPCWYPPHKMMNVEDDTKPWGAKWRAGTSNFRTVAELFTKRNLWALAGWRAKGDPLGEPTKSLICFAVTAMSKGMSKMCQYDEKWSFPYPIMSGTYYIPPIFKEPNVFKAVSDKLDAIIRGLKAANHRYSAIISTQSSTNLEAIPSNSIDYIFTDPPYAGNVQYGELNFIWEAWLGFDTNWHDEEIIINEIRGKTLEDWARDMLLSMKECHRVLKPGRSVSLCYHDTSEGTWALLQDIMAEAGFVVEKSGTALFIDTGQKSYNQLNADKVNKRDLVINFRKPKPEEAGGTIITELDDFASFNTKVCDIIKEYLIAYPGSTKDHIFDEVVSRMVRRGQMEPHSFDDLLTQVAEPVHPEGQANGAAHWYLRETEIDDSAESAKEDDAADTVRKFIARTKKPEDEGVHYSDIFEHYVYAVPAKDKPRRPLVEWLLDYFYKTDEGTYRLPTSEDEEKIKKEGRSQGISRRIKRYLAFLEQGVPVHASERPGDATLADWIRHCKLSGMYLEGKLLYEKGGFDPATLGEVEQANVEEDYDVCARMLARASGAEKKTKRTRKAKMAEEFEA